VQDSLTYYEETIEDALTALYAGGKMKEINAEKILLWPQSWCPVRSKNCGIRKKHIAGIVMLAAPARPLWISFLNRSIM